MNEHFKRNEQTVLWCQGWRSNRRVGEGVEERHWRTANVDESCLAHPVAMDTVSSSTLPVCVKERERGGEAEGERGTGRNIGIGRRQRENQSTCIRVSQSGSERAADSRLERGCECMCCQQDGGDRQPERYKERIEWECWSVI